MVPLRRHADGLSASLLRLPTSLELSLAARGCLIFSQRPLPLALSDTLARLD
jgi:hypothetical protein